MGDKLLSIKTIALPTCYAAWCCTMQHGARRVVGNRGKVTTSRVSVTVDRADHEFLARIAAEEERSVSWVAARAIHLFVAEARKGPVLGFEAPEKAR